MHRKGKAGVEEMIAHMTSTKPRERSLRGMSITTRFGLGTGLLLSLIVTVAVTGWLAMRYVRAAETSIRMSTDIQGMVLTMDRGMEKARRLHGDFFLQYPRIGLSRAHEQYAQPSVRQIAQVITVSDSLRALIARSDVGGALRTRQGDLNFYLSSAKRFADTSIRSVELVTELAAPERGLEAQLEGHFDILRKSLSGQDSLVHLLSRMRSFTRDYRITRKRHLMQSAFNAAFKLREAIAQERAFDDAEKKRFGALLDRCVSTGIRILAVDAEIRSKFNDFALQAEAVEQQRHQTEHGRVDHQQEGAQCEDRDGQGEEHHERTHHGVDQAHVQGLLRIVLTAEVPDFTGFFLADNPR